MAQVVVYLTLDFCSDLDLWVVSSSPMLGSFMSMEPTFKKKKKENNTFLDIHG